MPLPAPSRAAALVALAPALALADPSPEALAQAKEAFEKAERAFKVGDFYTALDDYKRSFLLSDEPLLLFNLAQCYRLLGLDVDAIRVYENFLRKADPSPNARALAESLIQTLKDRQAQPQLASVSVHATLDAEGARLFIDGVEVGPLPARKDGLTAGPHALEIRRGEQILFADELDLRPGELRSVAVSSLTGPAPRQTRVRVIPADPRATYQVSLQGEGVTAACPAPPSPQAPCDLRAPPGAAVTLRVSGDASLVKALVIPPKDSQLTLQFPAPSRAPLYLMIGGAGGVILAAALILPELNNFDEPNPARIPLGIAAGGLGALSFVGGSVALGLGKVRARKQAQALTAFSPLPR